MLYNIICQCIIYKLELKMFHDFTIIYLEFWVKWWVKVVYTKKSAKTLSYQESKCMYFATELLSGVEGSCMLM